MGREAVPFMHPGDQPGMPEFPLHGAIGLPPLPNEHFWPTLPYPPMLNPAHLAMTWPPKNPFQAILSQYFISGAAPQLNLLGAHLPEESSGSSSPETASPSQLSPATLEALRIRTQEVLLTSGSQQKLHANS